jgi:tRNA1(Val) A37 N6-methylase TrmN6
MSIRPVRLSPQQLTDLREIADEAALGCVVNCFVYTAAHAFAKRGLLTLHKTGVHAGTTATLTAKGLAALAAVA